ncbi:hypothetical protein B0H10DRAFT_2197032 [Mycena sp. CBHHK59/15]|nr:hypothetical protein B0H10DRAFT_2197032 [Mycena sp. CBHHK59/15]
MLQYLTHTSVQFYPRECWECLIRNVSKTVRKFSIAMAFILSSHVLAFPSIDLIFQKILRKLQPTWATNLSNFSIPPNIFTSMQDYLVLVAKWIEDKVLLGHHYICACDTIRKYNSLFYRIGVYTIMELFFLAARSEQDLWTLLQPSIHDGLLAPTMEQHLCYADWFLVDEFHLKLEELGNLDTVWGWDYNIQLCDVFEPTFLAAGLQAQTNLGHLIFGEDAWLSYGGKHYVHDDPITTVYRKYSGFHTYLLSSPAMLKPGLYTPLFLPHSKFCSKKSSHRPTFTFHDPKEMWTITQNFPLNSHWSSDPSIQKKKNMRPKAAQMISGTQHEDLFIKNITTMSLGVSIGPLEYCGVGHIVYIGTAAYTGGKDQGTQNLGA